MKPKNKVESVKRLSRYDGPNRRGGSFPRIDLNYQSRLEMPSQGGAVFRCSTGVLRPSLSRLTNEVFRSGPSRSFIAEATLFALITVLSVWPIVSMISALVKMLR